MMPARYYTKVFEDNGTTIRIVFLDTTPLIDRYRENSAVYPDACKQDRQAQLLWLDSTLKSAREDWVVVVGHHPIYAYTTKAEYERTEDEYERKLSLSEDNIVSKAELAQAKSAYDAAKAEYDNLAKYFQNGAFSAISDIDGYIDEVYVSIGDYVEAGQKLACVSHYSRYQVTAKVPSKYASELNHIEDAVFTDAAGNIFRLRDIDGHLITAGRSVSIENPLIPVTFEVRGKLGAVPGSFVDMRIVTKSADSVLTTDSRAIVEESGNFFVYKQLNPELYQKVQVSIGATDGLRTVINSGLQDGDIIVSKGAVILKLAQAAGTLDAHSGHVH